MPHTRSHSVTASRLALSLGARCAMPAAYAVVATHVMQAMHVMAVTPLAAGITRGAVQEGTGG